MFGLSLCKEMLAYVQSEPSLVQLWAIAVCLVNGLGRRAQHLPFYFPSSRSFREQWGHPSVSFSPNETNLRFSTVPHRSSSFHSVQPFHQLSCILWRCILLKQWGPELHPMLKVRLHQLWTQRDNLLTSWQCWVSWSQDGLCPPGCWALLTHMEPAVTQHPQIPSPPSSYLCLMLLHTRCRIWQFSLLNFMPLISALLQFI